MGADFLEKTKPSFKKAWDRGKLEVFSTDLLSRLPTKQSRSFAADLVPGASPTKGEKLIVESVGNTLIVSIGLREIARCEDPPSEISKTIGNQVGIASGEVEEVHMMAGVVEIAIE